MYKEELYTIHLLLKLLTLRLSFWRRRQMLVLRPLGIPVYTLHTAYDFFFSCYFYLMAREF